jgi:hypothetical protein
LIHLFPLVNLTCSYSKWRIDFLIHYEGQDDIFNVLLDLNCVINKLYSQLFKTKLDIMVIGLIHIGSLYCLSSISILLEWKKMEESTYRVILVAGPSLENWVQNLLEPFWGIKQHFLGLQCLKFVLTPLMVFYTMIPFEQCIQHLNHSSYAKVVLTIIWPTLLTTMVWVDATSLPIIQTCGVNPHYLNMWGYPHVEFQENSRRSKPNH